MKKFKQVDFLIKPILYLISLIAGAWLVVTIEKTQPTLSTDFPNQLNEFYKLKNYNDSILINKKLELNSIEKQQGIIAWNYFEVNYNQETGLFSSYSDTDVITIYDLSSYLMALISAYEIGIIEKKLFNTRIENAIKTIGKFPISKNQIPYSTYFINKIENKISAVNNYSQLTIADISRFFALVNKLKFDYPEYFIALRIATKTWNFNQIAGQYFFTLINKQFKISEKPTVDSWGNLLYAFRGLNLLGFDISDAQLYIDRVNQSITNYSSETNPQTYRNLFSEKLLANESFLLENIEYGFTKKTKELYQNIFTDQKNKLLKKSFITPYIDDYYNQACCCNVNYFCKNHNKHYTTKKLNQERIILTYLGFVWNILFEEELTKKTYNAIINLQKANNDCNLGKCEKSQKTTPILQTKKNGLILESLNFKKNGVIIRF